MASDGYALTGLWFDGQKYDRSTVNGDAQVDTALNVFRKAAAWLDQYFSGQVPTAEVPLKVEGSDFKILVADIMCSIPYGETMTYGDIAKEVARRTGREHMSAQAVGGAVGHNAISLIIPCHRVLGSNGSLTGYAGGTHRKSWLLNWEAEHG